MGLVKTLLVVGASAGIGAWAGSKAYDAVAEHLPKQLPPEATRIGFQAATGMVAFGVLRSVF